MLLCQDMHSFLIVSKDKRAREDFVVKMCQEQNIHRIDQSIYQYDNTIGIAEIRNLQKTLFFTPIKSQTKACIIFDAHNLTIEAQNALLKILEEPPNNTIIILTADNKEVFLPTVLSRCNIVGLKSPKNQSESSDLSSLTNSGVGYRLKLAQDLAKDKNEAIIWLEKMILALRQELIKDPANPSLFINHYSLFQKAYITLKTTNANPRLVLENLFLNFNKSTKIT